MFDEQRVKLLGYVNIFNLGTFISFYKCSKVIENCRKSGNIVFNSVIGNFVSLYYFLFFIRIVKKYIFIFWPLTLKRLPILGLNKRTYCVLKTRMSCRRTLEWRLVAITLRKHAFHLSSGLYLPNENPTRRSIHCRRRQSVFLCQIFRSPCYRKRAI